MSTAPADSAPVLNYAASPRQGYILRRLRGLVTVLFCMVLCGAFGWLAQPTSYRAVGLLQVRADTQVSDLFLDGGGVPSADGVMFAVAATLTSRDNREAVSKQLGGVVTPAQLTAGLQVRPVPNSRLIAVTYADADPRIAAAAANAAMATNAAPGVTIVAPAAVPTRPHHERFAVLAGLAVGLLLGVATVALRWK